MLNGATSSACAIAGTAVFRIVVSSDSMKNATATSHGTRRLPELLKGKVGEEAAMEGKPGLADNRVGFMNRAEGVF